MGRGAKVLKTTFFVCKQALGGTKHGRRKNSNLNLTLNPNPEM